MEDFSQVYTVEFLGSKGWEVAKTYEGLHEAIQGFRLRLLTDTEVAWRLTTPTRIPKTRPSAS